MIKNLILILLLVNNMVKSDFSSDSEEDDSGSIEIPARPENRKEAAGEMKGNNQDSPTFLRLISKFMETLKTTVKNTSRNAKNRLSGSGIQNAKKTLKGLQRAYILAEKAQKKFLKFFTIPKNMSKIEST